jgi:beta-glucosidase
MRRREVLQGAGVAALGLWAAPVSAAAAAVAVEDARFPAGFVWGASTSSYQIEGAATADGRGASIWDTFSHTPGRVANGDAGDVACDHYHRYLEDVGLLARAGLGAYRFSVAWPRIQATGRGAANPKGLDFYDRLVDALSARGVEPWVCLYHWDLPQALQDGGGWESRDIADRFTDYALIVAGKLGDRVKRWAMLNEPSVHGIFGYGMGGHAPGLTGRDRCTAALHHQNLAQGKAIAALRETGRKDWSLGTVLSLQPVKPVAGVAQAQEAAKMWDALWNRACLDPLFKGVYPRLLEADFAPLVRDGDMALIRQKVDFLGINYYSRMHQQPFAPGLIGTGFGPAPAGTPQTAMGWPVEPDGLTEQLLDLKNNYDNPPVYVSENGADYDDWVGPEGKAEDAERIRYIRDHLAAGREAIRQGCNLKGWFVWSLLDNFEWADGYSRRFGLVAVDRHTMRRTPKASYYWYAAAARANAVPPQ